MLTFKEAQLRAIQRERDAQRDDGGLNRKLTVQQAARRLPRLVPRSAQGGGGG